MATGAGWSVRWVVMGISAFLVGAGACTGVIDEPGGAAGGSGGPRSGGGAGDPAVEPALAPRVARLTHAQWENTVRDLFFLEAGPGLSEGFRTDPRPQGFLFDNSVTKLSVDQALWGAYQRAAEELASRIVGDPASLERILPAEGGDARARARVFVTEQGMRVHRRPLDEAQVEAYMAVYDAAPGLYEGLGDFESGIRLVLEAMLQSPHFLYRVEESTGEGDAVRLDGWEVASRLSYTLWNTMPDEALVDAAASGELDRPEGVEAQARRMLDDPRAEDVVHRFHAQLFDVDGYEGITSSVPDAPADLGALAARENELFVRDVYANGGGWTEMLTSTETWVNQDLARLYGLEGSYGDEMVRASLDPTRRRGVFTQIGFLAANATSTQPDPIHRGVYLSERIACAHLGAPPDMIPPLPPPMGRTNRETVEDHTERPGTICASCHSVIINPFGFPFEGYDAVGAFRTEDNGYPVDASARPFIGDREVPVEDAVELAEALAASDKVHACYAKHWVEFAFGRPEVETDEGLVTRLGHRSFEGASIRELIVEVVTSRAFLNRSTEELP